MFDQDDNAADQPFMQPIVSSSSTIASSQIESEIHSISHGRVRAASEEINPVSRVSLTILASLSGDAFGCAIGAVAPFWHGPAYQDRVASALTLHFCDVDTGTLSSTAFLDPSREVVAISDLVCEDHS